VTFEEAKAYMEERGKLEFFGRIGENATCFVYTLTTSWKTYRVFIYDDGKVEVMD
jgi:hypothetical protein